MTVWPLARRRLANLIVEVEGIRDRLDKICEGMRLAIRECLQHGAEEVIHGRHADRSFNGVTAALQGFGLVDVGFSRASLDEALEAFVPGQDRVVDAPRLVARSRLPSSVMRQTPRRGRSVRPACAR